MRLFLWSLALFWLAACSSEAVVFAPTPLPPEADPDPYTHPTGAFSLLMPRTWALYEQETTRFASASFSPPDEALPVVSVAVVNLGQAIAPDDLGALMDQYQSEVRPDVERYSEQERQAMGDGSWRISGVRETPAGQPQQVNTFIQRDGSLMAVVNVIVPQDAALRSQVQTLINTFEIGTDDQLPVADVLALSGTASAPVEIANVSTWTTPEGVFFVTGEVANLTDQTLADVPVRAILMSDDGTTVADALSSVMGHAIEAGGFAPFGVRFGQGQPINATRFTVTLGGVENSVTPREIITFPDLQWEDSTEFNRDGDLFVIGSVTNASSADVLSPRAIVTLFDSSGRVIGAGFEDADTSILRAGESANFTVLISDLGDRPSNYVVSVQALPCDASCE